VGKAARGTKRILIQVSEKEEDLVAGLAFSKGLSCGGLVAQYYLEALMREHPEIGASIRDAREEHRLKVKETKKAAAIRAKAERESAKQGAQAVSRIAEAEAGASVEGVSREHHQQVSRKSEQGKVAARQTKPKSSGRGSA
jgi:hypothetical protein